MQFTYSKMQLAQAVLELVKAKGREGVLDEVNVTLEAYQNGREQGFGLLAYREGTDDAAMTYGISRFVCWSEHRRSDSLVLYAAGNSASQGLTDEMYEHAKFFSPGDGPDGHGSNYLNAAADFIMLFLGAPTLADALELFGYPKKEA